MITKKIQFLFFFVVFTFYSSDACSCRLGQTSLKIYCEASWVAHFKVLDIKLINREYFEYTIDYIKVFKMPPQLNETYPTKIYSYHSDGMCGLELSKNDELLRAGYISRNSDDDYYDYDIPKDSIEIGHCTVLKESFQQKLKNGVPFRCGGNQKEMNSEEEEDFYYKSFMTQN